MQGYRAGMAQNKTQVTAASVAGFIQSVEPAARAAEADTLDALFRRATGQEPAMWGPTIIGYGQYHYVYASGREGDMCRVGFSPRKARHSLYISCERQDREDPAFTALLGRLGKAKRGGGGCLYVNKLADIDLAVLEQMVALAWQNSLEAFPA